MPHNITRLQSQFGREATDNFQDTAHISTGRDTRIGERHCVLRNARDLPVIGNKQHVERDVGIPHPHDDALRWLESKKHAMGRRHLPAIHQAGAACLRRARNFDLELVGRLVADDDEQFGRRGNFFISPRIVARQKHEADRNYTCPAGQISNAVPVTAALRRCSRQTGGPLDVWSHLLCTSRE